MCLLVESQKVAEITENNLLKVEADGIEVNFPPNYPRTLGSIIFC